MYQTKTQGNAMLEPPLALATRAGPLVGILERADAAKAPVMWEPA
ncbi:MAG: DUF1840 family protein [Steroidobacteraceae bacterium]